MLNEVSREGAVSTTKCLKVSVYSEREGEREREQMRKKADTLFRAATVNVCEAQTGQPPRCEYMCSLLCSTAAL